MNIGNLYEHAVTPVTGERFEMLLEHKNLAIERICSSSEIPQSQYVQTQDEWVLLVQGTAEIEIDGRPSRSSRVIMFFCQPTRLIA